MDGDAPPDPATPSQVTVECVATLVEKLEAAAAKLTPLRSEMISHDAVARTFEELSRAGRRTWQQGKRHVHQPQLESLIAHLELLGLVPPLDGSPAPEATTKMFVFYSPIDVPSHAHLPLVVRWS